MTRLTTSRLVLMLALLVMALPGLLLADEPCDKKSDDCNSTMVIIGDDGEEVTVTLEDGELTIISTDDDNTTTHIMDMDAIGMMANDHFGDVMVDVGDVLEELEDMQIQFRMGQDNRMNLSFDDSEFELDLDAVMEQVSSAVQLGLAEFDTAEWTTHSDRWDEVSDDELRDELDNLKDEMKELRRELKRLQKKERSR